MTSAIFRPAVSALTALAMVGLQAVPLVRALAAEGAAPAAAIKATVATTSRGADPAISRADYEACQGRDEAGFQVAVEAITERALRLALKTVNYDAAIGDAWRRRNMQKIIERQVDKAIKDVRDESSWSQLLKSLASQAKAKELATTVATRVYRSDAVKKAIEALAGDVGRSVGKRIELATVDAAEPARKCMQAFLGARYGQTVASIVSSSAGNQLEVDSNKAGAKVSSGSIVLRSGGGIAGVMVLIVRRQLAKIASRVGQRVLGAVLSRLVSVVAGGIGVVLIAKDIWDMRHGVLPIIADEMKSPASLRKVRHELAKEIKQQISLHVDDLGRKSAAQVVKIWRDFRQAHSKVLDLAESRPAFKTFLDMVPAAKMARLDEVVAIVLASEGEAGVMARLQNGTLDEAVKRLSAPAMQIARDRRSLRVAFDWSRLAGNRLAEVVKFDIHRHTSPSQFSKSGLRRILSLDDELAVTRLAGLSREARASLFELAQKDLTTLARALSAEQLDVLSRYLTGLQRQASQRLLFAIAANPRKMNALAKPGVRDALLASRDQLAAVNMMVRANSTFDPTTFMDDLTLLRDLKISPWLIWERYPTSLTVLGILALLILLLLWRLIFGRRTKVVLQMPPGHAVAGHTVAGHGDSGHGDSAATGTAKTSRSNA